MTAPAPRFPTRRPLVTATFMPVKDAVLITGLSPAFPVLQLPADVARALHDALTRALATPDIAARQSDLFAEVRGEAAEEIRATSPKTARRVMLTEAQKHMGRAADWLGREGEDAAIIAATLRAAACATSAAQISHIILNETP